MWRTHLKRAVIVFVASIVVVQAVFWTSVRLPVPDVPVPELGEPELTGRSARLGGSVLEQRQGYWFFVHRGDPVTIGAEHARLGEFLIQRVERALFADFEQRMPAPVRLLLPPYLMWTYRHMPFAIPEEQREELWGFSATYTDSYPLHPYRRGMYYHALHDITQELVGNPWVDPSVAGACTGFAATGEGTVDGHLLLGRNFDFEVFPLFDEEKVVHLFARDGAIPVFSISWMAMSGVVTGMNADGIWMSLNAARSEGTNRKGPPVSLRIRTILEQARSLDDVRRLLAEVDPIVSDIYLVGDGKTGEATIIERGQTRMDERGPVRGKLSAANHLLTDTFAGDSKDQGLRDYSTTLARGMRMAELVDAEPLSVPRALAILRDKEGPGGLDIAPGNRNAIDAVIATHSVIFDATDRVFWVSTAPNTQGAYRAIDLMAELDAAGIDSAPFRATLPEGSRAWEAGGEPAATPATPGEQPPLAEAVAPALPPADLPPDAFTAEGGFDQLRRVRGYLEDAEFFLGEGSFELAADMARRAEALEPRSSEAAWLLGDACRERGDEACARAAFTDYLHRFPAFGPKHAQATDWLAEHGGVPAVERPDRVATP